MTAPNSRPPRKEQLEIKTKCEICYTCAAKLYLERGPLMWMMPLHINQNNDDESAYDDDNDDDDDD